MRQKYAYIDETGNFGFDFDKPNVSTHYICTAVIVEEENLKSLNSLIETISNKNFGGAELKAGRLRRKKKNVDRILNQLASTKFHAISLITDKREMYSKGLSYKSVFYKFLNGLLYKELYDVYPRLNIVNDEFGSPEYMQSFIEYVRKNQYSNLFGQSDFQFIDSEDSRIVQLADVIGGIIAESYDLSYDSKKLLKYLSLFDGHIIKIQEWPNNFRNVQYSSSEDHRQFDRKISDLSLNLAYRYLESHSSKSSQNEADRINCLNYLLLQFKHHDALSYIYGAEIIAHLNKLRNGEIDERYFRTEVISKLRDSEVLIASSNKGYKLPCAKRDLYEFVSQTSNMVLPMIWRLYNVREKIRLATANKLDILDAEEFSDVKKAVDALHVDNSNRNK